jgi:hypothetical protein
LIHVHPFETEFSCLIWSEDVVPYVGNAHLHILVQIKVALSYFDLDNYLVGFDLHILSFNLN